jgi:DNA-binding transcriptional MocR family regulator
MTTQSPALFLYEYVAGQLAKQINVGHYKQGDKIPGTRLLSEKYGVSINTILQAQKILENQGLIEAVPRSGFYVKWRFNSEKSQLINNTSNRLKPTLITRQRLALDLIQATGNKNILQLGAALPHDIYFPTQELQRITTRLIRTQDTGFMRYEVPPGLPSLCKTIAHRMIGYGCNVASEDILITNGCHEALSIALKCVAKPGDVVLLESPTYYGLLQVVDTLGLRAIEIPCSPDSGIDLTKVSDACQKWDVKACILVSNFSNPLGNCPNKNQKQALLSLLNTFNVPLVEDDIYGDLAFDGHRPTPYKQFDTTGDVLYCSSFSKTVSPGLRVGWLSPGRYVEKAAYLKFTQNIATSTLNQMVLDEYLRSGNVDKHIRKIRRTFASNIAQCIELINNHFPQGTRTSQPHGGFVLWIQLPETFDTSVLYHKASNQNISIAPGNLFTSDQRYKNYFRINCGLPWKTTLAPALQTLGLLLSQLEKNDNQS